jgi:hypothetical protein
LGLIVMNDAARRSEPLPIKILPPWPKPERHANLLFPATMVD